MRRHAAVMLLCLIMLVVARRTLAQGTVFLSPTEGPPGTSLQVSYDAGYPPEQMVGFTTTCSSSFFSQTVAYGSVILVSIPNDPPGTVYTISCVTNVPDAFPVSASFTVTAPPVQDTDGDGVPDDVDKCPTVFWQGDGCPLDSDGDGVTDNIDACPQEFAQTPNGCPSPTQQGPADSDGDGVVDGTDLCPQEFAQTPNGCPSPTATPNVAPTATPNTQPSTTGECVVTPGGNAVNVRAEASTDAAVVAQLEAGQTSAPDRLENGWYFLPALNGWVRADVVVVSGDCTNLGSAGADESGALPLVIAAENDFQPDFELCPDLVDQGERLPMSTLLRLVNSGDPCGGLRNTLQTIVFGDVGAFQRVAPDELGLEATCSTDLRPFPTPEALRLLNNLRAFNPELYARVIAQLQIAASEGPNTAGDDLLCALMRGDGFMAGTRLSIDGILTDREPVTFWATMCVPPLELDDVRMTLRGFNEGWRLREGGPPLLNPLTSSESASWLGDETNSLAERRAAFCALLGELGRQLIMPSELPPSNDAERRELVEWVRQCNFLPGSQLAVLEASLRGESVGGLNLGVATLGNFWSVLLQIRREYGMRCPTSFTAFLDDIERILEGRARLADMTTSIDSGLLNSLTPDYSFAGVVYEVRCSASGASDLALPPDGCSARTVANEVVGEPAFITVFEPDTVRNEGEPGLAGVTISIHEGACSAASGSLSPLMQVISDENGLFAVNGLPAEGQYCAIASVVGGRTDFGSGQWWTPRSSGSTTALTFTARANGAFMAPVGFGWLPASSAETDPVVVIDDGRLAMLERPFEPPLPSPMAGTMPTPITMSVQVVVFDDQCNRSGWDGTAAGTPAGCVTFPGIVNEVEISANGTRGREEIGIPGVTVSLIEGACESSNVVATGVTDASGLTTLTATASAAGQPYCAIVDAEASTNAGALTQGSWTTISGPRIYYGFIANSARTIRVDFPWWRGGEGIDRWDEVLIPPATPDQNVTPLPPGEQQYTLHLMTLDGIVFDDRCDAASWDGDVSRVPAGCTALAPGVVRANTSRESDETGIAGIQVELWYGSCITGGLSSTVVSAADGGLTSGGSWLGIAGDYCLIFDATRADNAAILGSGMWSATGGQVLRIPVRLDRDMVLRPIIGWWRVAPGSPERQFFPVPGVLPFIPRFGAAICPSESPCEADLPPMRTPPSAPTGDDNTLILGVPPEDVAVVEAIVASGWQDFQGSAPGLGAFIGRSAPDAPPNLFLYDGGKIYDIGVGSSSTEEAAAVSPDGTLIAYIGRGDDGNATLFVLNASNGVYVPIFWERPTELTLASSTPRWSPDGSALWVTMLDATNVPAVYTIPLDDPVYTPTLALQNAGDPVLSDDGALLAFVREGDVYVRFVASGDERSVTDQPDGSTCESPFFDTAGINLYFVCRDANGASLFVQGFDGLQPVLPNQTNIQNAGRGPAEGTITFDDGTTAYLMGVDGTGLTTLIQVSDLLVSGLRWP